MIARRTPSESELVDPASARRTVFWFFPLLRLRCWNPPGDTEILSPMAYLDLHARVLGPEHVAHTHDFHQVILATSGVTDLDVEGLGGRVTATRGCLIPRARHHEYEGDGLTPTLVLDIPQAGLDPRREDGDIARLFDRPRFFSVPPRLNQLAGSLMIQLEQCPALHNEIAALLLRALYLYLEDGRLQQTADPRSPTGNNRLDLSRLDGWIDRHLADEIRVDQLSGLCALSVGHFHACFRELTGMTPLAYVQCRRLEHAHALVHHSGLSLGQIASLVGFRDQGSFSRAYRRQFSTSPSAQRRRDREI